MKNCPICRRELTVARLLCQGCGVSYGGGFERPRLARLSTEHQDLAEQLLLAGGSLKAVAQALGVSYPTLKKRLQALQSELEALRQRDRQAADADLEAVEHGRLTSERAARRIRERNGGA